MNTAGWLFCAIFGYIIYSNLKGKYKLSKRNELKYDESAVRIPVHLCATDNSDDTDLTFEQMEAYCQNDDKNIIAKPAYKTVKWNDIKSWEYSVVIHMNFNDTLWLYITTEDETISVTDVNRRKMKRYFKKYVKEKQIVNLSNKMEIWGILLSCVIIAVFAYKLFFNKA
jgi:hypothetical protein